MADVRAGSSRAAQTRGCSSPACPIDAGRRRPARRSGRGATAPAPPRAPSSSTPDAAATSRAASHRVGPARRSAGPHQPRGSRLPASATATCQGCSGTAPSRAASVSSSGRRSTPGSGAGARSPPGNTAPCSNSARSRWPRDEVAGQRGEQAGQQRRPQRRLLLRQRVAHDDDLPARVVLGAGPGRPAPPSRRTGRTAPRRTRPRPACGRRCAGGAARRSARGPAAPSAAPTGCRRSRRAGRPPRPGRPGRSGPGARTAA